MSKKKTEHVLDNMLPNCLQENVNTVANAAISSWIQEDENILQNIQKNTKEKNVDSDMDLYSITVNRKSPMKPKWRKKTNLQILSSRSGQTSRICNN